MDHILKQLSENSDSVDVATTLLTDGTPELMQNVLKEVMLEVLFFFFA